MALLRLEESFKTRKSGSARCCRRLSASDVRRKPDRWGRVVAYIRHFDRCAGLTIAFVRTQERIAVNINVGANVLLLAAKGVATIFSSSLSLLASLADSALDLLSTSLRTPDR